MTIHSSLKTKSGALSQHRNVLTRAERISRLSSQEKFLKDANSPLGIVKVGNIMVSAGKKKKAEGEAAAVPAVGGAPVAVAATPGAKPGAGAKPVAGAKPGAPVTAGAKPAAGVGAAAKAPAGGAKGGDSKKKK